MLLVCMCMSEHLLLAVRQLSLFNFKTGTSEVTFGRTRGTVRISCVADPVLLLLNVRVHRCFRDVLI